jgi:hypothetical protein
MAVVPARCRLIGERQFRDPLGEFGVVEIAGVQMGIGIEFRTAVRHRSRK